MNTHCWPSNHKRKEFYSDLQNKALAKAWNKKKLDPLSSPRFLSEQMFANL